MPNLLLFLAIAAFVLQSQFVSLVQSSYYQPFFLLYICHSAYILFLPGLYIYYYLYQNTASLEVEFLGAKKSLEDSNSLSFSTKMTLLTFVFTCTSLFWYSAVSKIPIGEITAIYNTSCFFTYILSLYFLNEQFSTLKFSAVLLSIAGICTIALLEEPQSPSKSTASNEALIGYSFAILSSICAASYEIIYTRLAIPKTPSLVFSLYITSLIGFITICFGFILFPLFHFTGIEVFILPPPAEYFYISLIAILGLIFNSVFLLVITFSGPVTAATGILVSIPLTSLLDYILVGTRVGWNILIGSILIFVGFVLLQYSGSVHGDDEESGPLLSQGFDED